MQNNNLWKPFVLTLLVVSALLALFYLPRFSVLGHDMRRVNLLSDIQRRTDDGRILAEVYADSVDGIVEETFDSASVKVEHIAYVDSVPEGMTAIEDFGATDADTDYAARTMDHFYEALSSASERPVRIAYFGDSYIEGDILTAHLRDMLQSRYGGSGVGFVDISSITAGFRTTVGAKSSGWVSHNANDVKGTGFRKDLQGVNGRYYIPSGNATVELRCTPGKIGQHLAKVDKATVYFTSGPGMELLASINSDPLSPLLSEGGEPTIVEETHKVRTMHIDTVRIDPVPASSADGTDAEGVNHEDLATASPTYRYDTVYSEKDVSVRVGEQELGNVEHKSITGNISRFSMQVHKGEGSRFYGVALDGTHGISLDNFSMRGSNGWYIADIPESTLRSFAHQRPYDLIILHFGLNVANVKQRDYSGYSKRMANSIRHLRKCYPNASILVISVADRDEKGPDGTMQTMTGIRELVGYQRKMAADTHVAFWNLYEAMGGNGSLADLVEHHQANLDYTHINFSGGKRLASLLYDVLLNGKENYDNRYR